MQALQAVGRPPYGQCDDSHAHLPWGVKATGKFRTAEEAEYPHMFCKVVAAIVKANTRDPAPEASVEIVDVSTRDRGGVETRPDKSWEDA
eukprot:16227446-Heterocapsa_arctica.AAC.1